MGTSYNPKTVTDGLVLCLDAANPKSYSGTGTTWTDLSGNNSNGTLVDGPTFSTANKGSVVFDGVANRVHVTSLADKFSWTPSGAGLNNLTIDFFVNTNDSDGNLISKPWNGNGEYNYRITNNFFYLQIGNQNYSLNYTSFHTNGWQHICGVLTSTQIGLYRNGSIYANFTNHNITNNTPVSGNGNIPLCLMSLYPYNSGWLGNSSFSSNGNLGIVRIYNRVLTSAEIQQNFNYTKSRYGL